MILSALLVCSAAACSGMDKETSSQAGDTSSASDESSAADEGVSFPVIDASSLPAKVDLRNFNGKNYVTPVKFQRNGDCWTFALAACAETGYMLANDMGVPAGEVNDKVDFSEKYIAWYMFHGMTKDDVVTGRVRASQTGEGFDHSEAEKNNPTVCYYFGGAFVHAADLFASGFGPVDESLEINGNTPFEYYDSTPENWVLPLNAEYRCAPVNAFQRSSVLLPSPSKYDAKGNYEYVQAGIDAMKSELSKGHCIAMAICSSHSEINMENKAVYYTGEGKTDHGVAVIGYDDNYPKEKFTRTNKKGEVIEGSTPPADGAFIIKNSWGKIGSDPDDADDGYIFISYYDHSMDSPVSYEFDNNAVAKHTEFNYDQYDLMMTQWYVAEDSDTEVKMANVFEAEEDGELFQIVYRTAADKTQVTYEIYKDVENNDPASGTLLEKGTDVHLYAGSYKTDLKGEYQIKKGDRYSVVLTMKRAADDNGKMVYTEMFPYAIAFVDGLTVNGIINEGESYLYSDGKWSDMSSMKDSLTDKAYEQAKNEIISNIMLPSVTDYSKDKTAVDNYPIKAVLAPVK